MNAPCWMRMRISCRILSSSFSCPLLPLHPCHLTPHLHHHHHHPARWGYPRYSQHKSLIKQLKARIGPDETIMPSRIHTFPGFSWDLSTWWQVVVTPHSFVRARDRLVSQSHQVTTSIDRQESSDTSDTVPAPAPSAGSRHSPESETWEIPGAAVAMDQSDDRWTNLQQVGGTWRCNTTPQQIEMKMWCV